MRGATQGVPDACSDRRIGGKRRVWAPAVGVSLHVVEGIGIEAQQVAQAFGPGRPLWEARIPLKLFYELQRHGLLETGYLPNGAKEIAFRAEASQYITSLFTRIP